MRSIRTKIFALVGSAVGCAVLLMAAISALAGLNTRYDAKRLELQGTAATIAVAVAHPLAQGRGPDLARTLSSMGRIPGISYARVSDLDGRVVQQFGFGVVVTHDEARIVPNQPVGPLSAA